MTLNTATRRGLLLLFIATVHVTGLAWLDDVLDRARRRPGHVRFKFAIRGNSETIEAHDEASATAAAQRIQQKYGLADADMSEIVLHLLLIMARGVPTTEMKALQEDRKKAQAAWSQLKATRIPPQHTNKLSSDAAQLKAKGLLVGDHSVCQLRLLRDALRRGVPGDVVEAGVENGGSGSVLAHGLATHTTTPHGIQRKLWLFDSFQGMPPSATENESVSPMPYVGNLENVKGKLGKSGLHNDAIMIKIGWFNTSLYDDPLPAQIAFLHLDSMYYESVLDVLRVLYARVSPGGIVLISDFGEHDGARRAFFTFCGEQKIAPLVHKSDATRLWWIKGEEHTQAGGEWYDSLCYNPSVSENPSRWVQTTQQVRLVGEPENPAAQGASGMSEPLLLHATGLSGRPDL